MTDLTAINPSASYDLNDVIQDTSNLHHLLATAVSEMLDLDFGNGPARNHQLDRVNALLVIARNLSGTVSESASESYGRLARQTNQRA